MQLSLIFRWKTVISSVTTVLHEKVFPIFHFFRRQTVVSNIFCKILILQSVFQKTILISLKASKSTDIKIEIVMILIFFGKEIVFCLSCKIFKNTVTTVLHSTLDI